ncbi:helix-turn-helix domain-containing protein [Desulfofustis glycolicus]|uniref:DNA binding domain-containing protein, excisionase family n=1 Tax=Desulfofustis glycolicus DSM 9705 TaxID=1121409 RepID=A0A1M5XQT6_9BACT|nr:helix-turn-helix domain-containing protein [Desulfofustis glycolicus]SHI01894.1 DNA binding domain-containing protein, excisionase family [Desulfofustis glycolicus DSM 9705]
MQELRGAFNQMIDEVERLKSIVEGSVGKDVDDDELLTVPELASKLRVPESWVYAQTRRQDVNRIPHLRIGKYRRFRLDEVLAWLDRRAV